MDTMVVWTLTDLATSAERYRAGMLLAATDPTVLDNLSKLGPVATGTAAVVALLVGVVTVVQRNRADRRDQWWKRAQWAFDLALTDDPAKIARAFAVLTYLAESKLARKDEQKMLEAWWSTALEDGDDVSDNGSTTSEGGTDDGSSTAER